MAWSRRSKRCECVGDSVADHVGCGRGLGNTAIAAKLDIHVSSARKWRSRFVVDRLDGLVDEARPGRPRTVCDEQVEAVGDLNLPQENLQKKLDEMTGKLTDNELNIRVDSLQVTDDGVVGKFSAKNVDIPNGDAGGDGQTGGCAGL